MNSIVQKRIMVIKGDGSMLIDNRKESGTAENLGCIFPRKEIVLNLMKQNKLGSDWAAVQDWYRTNTWLL